MFKFKQEGKEDLFWKWFSKNEKKYLHFEDNQSQLFLDLKAELNKINNNLVFEFSPFLEGRYREFVISADGIKSIFPLVSNLVNKAPKFNNWKIIAFRQPHKNITHIHYKNLVVNLDDVFFRYAKDNGQIALELNMRGFYESPEWSGAAFILLDNVLGEYHTEMSLSSIDKKLLNETEINDLFSIRSLPEVIQNYHFELNN